VIVLYAGRRPGSDPFPDANVDFVGDQIRQLLAGLRPRLVVGSAAAGADLLTLEAAEGLGIPARAIVVGDRDAFGADSVADKGARWRRSYDHQLDRLHVEELPTLESSEESYRAVTRRIAEHGEELAKEGEAIVVLAVSMPRDGVDHTEELVQHGTAPGRLVLRIDPALRRDDMPRAFVAMPFGAKPYPDRGWRRFDADLSYQRVMLPALIDAGYRPLRADTDALLEVIDHTMLREINGAEVMLVDLAMLNANVMWELGLRHAWRRSGTILLAPDWVKPPFDVRRVPIFSYRRTAQRIGDRDAIEAIRTLQRVLRSVRERRVDSPVFANVNDLPEVTLPDAPDTDDEGAGALLEACTLAGDLGDVEQLLLLGERVSESADLSPVARTALHEQIGLRLISLDRYEEARKLLEPLARADDKLLRRRLQEQYAHVLIRSSDGGDQRLVEATERLQALRERHGDAGETLGLLGSAAKAQVEAAVSAERKPPPVALDQAIRAYRDGMRADPGNYYPGINAVALLRLRGQHWGGPASDLESARALLPVVRFATGRTQPGGSDVWARLTVGECALHEYLLDGAEWKLDEARSAYTEAAGAMDPQQRRSALRQLELMFAAGDPPEVMQPLLALFDRAG
jgi:hypothetical protein